MATFKTLEKNGSDEPLIEGLFVDLGAELDKEKTIIGAIKKMRESSEDMKNKFKTPFIVMDLAAPKDVGIEGEASYPSDDADDSLVSEDYSLNPNVKLLIPATQVVDLAGIAGLAGTKTVKCNQMIPAYRWFQSANLLLAHAGLKTRVTPFPLEHEKGVTYHMLPVEPQEFQLYQQILEYGTREQGLEAGFATAAKFSYEILGKRGIKEMTEEQVDAALVHVVLGQNDGKCQGILFHRAARSDFEELAKTHFVFY